MKDRKLWPKLRNGTQWALIVAFITGACSPTVSQPKETEPVPATPVVQITDFVPSPPPEELPTAAEKQETLPPVATEKPTSEPTPAKPLPGGSYLPGQIEALKGEKLQTIKRKFKAWLDYWNSSGLYNFNIENIEWAFNPTNPEDAIPLIETTNEKGVTTKNTFPVDVDNEKLDHVGTGKLRFDAPAPSDKPFIIAEGDGPLPVSSGRGEVLGSLNYQPIQYNEEKWKNKGEFKVDKIIDKRWGTWASDTVDAITIPVDLTDDEILEAAKMLPNGGCCRETGFLGSADLDLELSWVLIKDRFEMFYMTDSNGIKLRVTALVGVTSKDAVAHAILVPVQAEEIDNPGVDILMHASTMCLGQDGWDQYYKAKYTGTFQRPSDVVDWMGRLTVINGKNSYKSKFVSTPDKLGEYGDLDEYGRVITRIISGIPGYWTRLDILTGEGSEVWGENKPAIADGYTIGIPLGLNCRSN